MARRLIKSFEVPVFPRAKYTITVEPVHGGGYITFTNENGEVIERAIVQMRPEPRWFPFRVVRWGKVLMEQILRIHFAPEGGWEALEKMRDEKRNWKPKG